MATPNRLMLFMRVPSLVSLEGRTADPALPSKWVKSLVASPGPQFRCSPPGSPPSMRIPVPCPQPPPPRWGAPSAIDRMQAYGPERSFEAIAFTQGLSARRPLGTKSRRSLPGGPPATHRGARNRSFATVAGDVKGGLCAIRTRDRRPTMERNTRASHFIHRADWRFRARAEQRGPDHEGRPSPRRCRPLSRQLLLEGVKTGASAHHGTKTP